MSFSVWMFLVLIYYLIVFCFQPLAEMQGKAVYIDPKWSDPAQAGATCTGLPYCLLFP
jgi:hypothetical protein